MHIAITWERILLNFDSLRELREYKFENYLSKNIKHGINEAKDHYFIHRGQYIAKNTL